MNKPILGGACFSPDRMYRYGLWRLWGQSCVAFIGLNPSTADETKDDNTIKSCIRLARGWGYGGIAMLNLFGFRSTDPVGLYDAIDPIGDENDQVIEKHVSGATIVVVAWGNHAAPGTRFHLRARYVIDLMFALNKPTFHLGLTGLGAPRHPLYLRADTKPLRFSL